MNDVIGLEDAARILVSHMLIGRFVRRVPTIFDVDEVNSGSVVTMPMRQLRDLTYHPQVDGVRCQLRLLVDLPTVAALRLRMCRSCRHPDGCIDVGRL